MINSLQPISINTTHHILSENNSNTTLTQRRGAKSTDQNTQANRRHSTQKLEVSIPEHMLEKLESRPLTKSPNDISSLLYEIGKTLYKWEQSTPYYFINKENRSVASQRILNYISSPPQINLLNLNNLQLSSIPSCLESMDIQYLDLSNNNICNLQRELINLSTKCYVNITDNPLTPENIRTLFTLANANSAEYDRPIGAPKYNLIYNIESHNKENTIKKHSDGISKNILFCC